MDPETEFLMSNAETGNEWEVFKENVRPLKRGRNVAVLNSGLSGDRHGHLKARRDSLLRAVADYAGDDPLDPWLRCIKWVQDAFPAAGDSSGLLLIYEQCVRAFWHSHLYKDDLRYLKVWLEYAQHCVDARVIYDFLEANGIGTGHSLFYISYASHLESRNNVKLANNVLNLGISRNARPVEPLKNAFRRFLARSMQRPPRPAEDDDSAERRLPQRSFGTLLSRGENQMRAATEIAERPSKNAKQNRGSQAVPLSIFKDSSVVENPIAHESDTSKTDTSSWRTLGSRAERNKENTAMPAKWKSFKVPQRPGTRLAGSSASIEVFIDEGREEKPKTQVENCKAVNLHPRQEDDKDLKKEMELLRNNPLRNFPPNSLPR